MSDEKLNELKSKCSIKEARFLELWVNGEEKFNAFYDAGFKAKSTKVASAAVCRLLKKVSCSAYLQALKDKRDTELQRKTNISRTTQLASLIAAKDLAESLNNPSAIVSAIREMNEMLGYHRENAPNPEREAARKRRFEAELGEIRRLVRIRTAELSVVDAVALPGPVQAPVMDATDVSGEEQA